MSAIQDFPPPSGGPNRYLRLALTHKQACAEIDKLREGLATALEYAGHDAGCSRPYGENFRCKCRWLAEEPALRALLSTEARS